MPTVSLLSRGCTFSVSLPLHSKEWRPLNFHGHSLEVCLGQVEELSLDDSAQESDRTCSQTGLCATLRFLEPWKPQDDFKAETVSSSYHWRVIEQLVIAQQRNRALRSLLEVAPRSRIYKGD